MGTEFASAAGAKSATTDITSASQNDGAAALIKLGSTATTALGGTRATSITAGGTYAAPGKVAGGGGFTDGEVQGPGTVTAAGRGEALC